MNLNEFNHLMHVGKLAYEGFHKVKEFIHSLDEPADKSLFDTGKYNFNTEPTKVEDGNCQKCNYSLALELSPCCKKILCHACNRFDKGSYCRFCHLASSQ